MTSTPAELAAEAAAVLAEKTGVASHDIALVMGSGWLPAVDALGEATAELTTTDLPGFAPPAVQGHAGKIRSVRSGDKNLLVFLGRTHFYEGLGVRLGGARRPHRRRRRLPHDRADQRLRRPQGDLDARHAGADQRPRQPHRDVADRGRQLRRPHRPLLPAGSGRCAARSTRRSTRASTCQFPGPHYETPAEIRMVRAIGGDLVGMSTVLEAIAAREAGLEVLGISLVTNLAAGITGEPLNHAEVLEAGKAAASRMGDLLGAIVPRI